MAQARAKRGQISWPALSWIVDPLRQLPRVVGVYCAGSRRPPRGLRRASASRSALQALAASPATRRVGRQSDPLLWANATDQREPWLPPPLTSIIPQPTL